jgi:pyridoxal phosphate enzyme (YggS family)
LSALAERYHSALARIEASAAKHGRDGKDVQLIVVTKFHSASLVLELIELGATEFGENKDQEAGPKALEVAAATDKPHRWHFVGQLQSNKVRSALAYTQVLHSLDRQSLLDALVKSVVERPKPLDVFIQLNLTDDPGRGGIEPKNLLEFSDKVLEQPGLNLLGVMGVAALDRAPEIDFETIALASAELQKNSPGSRFISSGMSQDFESAIGFGATHLRIGAAITGKREY